MKTLRLLPAALALGMLVGCDDKKETTGMPVRTKVSQSVEYQLAIQNARGLVAEDHPTIPQFKAILEKLDPKYPEDPQAIANLSIEAQRSLESASVNESVLTLMQNVDKAAGTHKDYATAVNAYVARRKSGGR